MRVRLSATFLYLGECSTHKPIGPTATTLVQFILPHYILDGGEAFALLPGGYVVMFPFIRVSKPVISKRDGEVCAFGNADTHKIIDSKKLFYFRSLPFVSNISGDWLSPIFLAKLTDAYSLY